MGCGRTLNLLQSVTLLLLLDWRSGTNIRLVPDFSRPVLHNNTSLATALFSTAVRPPGFCTMVIMDYGQRSVVL